MKLNTNSGLRGDIVASIEIERTESVIVHVMIVRNPDAAYPLLPYSTHRVYERVSDFDQRSTFTAEAGHYDMTLEAAQDDLINRAEWPFVGMAR